MKVAAIYLFVFKKKIKHCLFTNNMIIYIEKPKESNEKPLQKLISDFSNNTRLTHKINRIYKYDKVEIKFENTIPFTVAPQEIKYNTLV